MCFSATASFTAGVTLSALGMANYQKIKSSDYRLLGIFPFLFATQQFLEGIVWLTIGNSSLSSLNLVVRDGFLLFATGIWPILCPLAVYLGEKNSLKRKVIFGLVIVGGCLGIYLFGFVITHGVQLEKFSGNLLYDLTVIPLFAPLKYLYLLVTSLPFVLSERRPVRLFGLAAIASFGLANLFYNLTFVSVWCFFAAVLSGALYFILDNSQSQIHNIYE